MQNSNRIPRVSTKIQSRQDESEQFPESDILKEINRVHGRYSQSGQSTDENQSDSPSLSPSRPITGNKRGEKKRIGEGVPRQPSFSTRPVLPKTLRFDLRIR